MAPTKIEILTKRINNINNQMTPIRAKLMGEEEIPLDEMIRLSNRYKELSDLAHLLAFFIQKEQEGRKIMPVNGLPGNMLKN